MKDKTIFEQLNKEIESVELPNEILDNILLEMRREKARKLESVKEKKRGFKFTARMRNAVAVFSVALLMIVAIPVSQTLMKDNTVSPPTPNPMMISPRFIENQVDYTEVDAIVSKNIALPMNFAKENSNYTTLVYDGSEVSLVKQSYNFEDNSMIIIDIDLNSSNDVKVVPIENYDLDGMDVQLINKNKSSGTLKFDFNNAVYYISFQSLQSKDNIQLIIEDILKDN